MKSKTLSTIQTFVFVVLFSCLTSVIAHADGGSNNNGPSSGWGMSDKAVTINTCQSVSSKISEDAAKFQSYCGSSSDPKECVSNIQNCTSNNSSEDLDSSDNDPDNSAQCYAFGYQSYKSDLKDMTQQERDSRKTLQDLQKQKTDAQKDYNDQKSKLMKDFQDATDDYNKQALQDKDDQRKQQTDQKQQQDSAVQQISDLQMKVLQAQNQQSLLTSQRATQIDDYKMKLLQCKADTQKYQQQVSNHTLGGLAALSVQGGGASNDVNTYWQTCVNKVLKTRDDDANKYSVAMTQLNAQISQYQQQLGQAQQSLSLMQTQAQQLNADNQTKTQQEFQSYQQKQKNIAQQLQDLSQNYMQQSMQMAQDIQQAQQDNNIDSNSLKKFQGQTPPKTDTTATDAFRAYRSATNDCANYQSMCAAVGIDMSSTCSGLSSTSKYKNKSGSKSSAGGVH